MEGRDREMQVEEAFAVKQNDWHKWRQSHAFALLKLNDPTARYPYYVIRCKRDDMNDRIKTLRKKHRQALVIFQHRKVPNEVNLYKRLRIERLVISHVNYCTPIDDNESHLLSTLKEMCATSEYPADVNFPINLDIEVAAAAA